MEHNVLTQIPQNAQMLVEHFMTIIRVKRMESAANSRLVAFNLLIIVFKDYCLRPIVVVYVHLLCFRAHGTIHRVSHVIALIMLRLLVPVVN